MTTNPTLRHPRRLPALGVLLLGMLLAVLTWMAVARADQQALEHYLASMVQELSLIGYGPGFARAMFGCAIDDLVAVRFTPLQAFDQTPGPHAGTALSGTRNTAT